MVSSQRRPDRRYQGQLCQSKPSHHIDGQEGFRRDAASAGEMEEGEHAGTVSGCGGGLLLLSNASSLMTGGQVFPNPGGPLIVDQYGDLGLRRRRSHRTKNQRLVLSMAMTNLLVLTNFP